MALVLTPDIAITISEYLGEHEDLEPLHDGQVGTKTPRQVNEGAWVKITQIDDGPGDPRSSANHFRSAPLQFDCYAQDQEDASELVRAVRAALHSLKHTKPDLGDVVVTDVRFGTCPYLPDRDIDAKPPGKPRYSQTATVYFHNASDVLS